MWFGSRKVERALLHPFRDPVSFPLMVYDPLDLGVLCHPGLADDKASAREYISQNSGSESYLV